MNLVGVGLALMYWAFVVFVASLAIMAGCAFAGGTAGSGVVAVGLVGAGVGAIAAALMVIVGQFLCLAVPRETGAKGLIIAAIVLEFCAVLSPFLIAQALVAELQGSLSPQYAALVPALLTMVLALAAQITFLLFLRQLADYLRRSDLSDKVQTILLFYVVQIVLPFVMIPVAFVLALLPPIVAGLFGIALGLGMLGFARSCMGSPRPRAAGAAGDPSQCPCGESHRRPLAPSTLRPATGSPGPAAAESPPAAMCR
jgi:hypothetical protein